MKTIFTAINLKQETTNFTHEKCINKKRRQNMQWTTYVYDNKTNKWNNNEFMRSMTTKKEESRRERENTGTINNHTSLPSSNLAYCRYCTIEWFTPPNNTTGNELQKKKEKKWKSDRKIKVTEGILPGEKKRKNNQNWTMGQEKRTSP